MLLCVLHRINPIQQKLASYDIIIVLTIAIVIRHVHRNKRYNRFTLWDGIGIDIVT